MKIGYFKLDHEKNRRLYQEELQNMGASIFFSDTKKKFTHWQEYPQMEEALTMAKPGDSLLIRKLEDISYLPEEWLSFIERLDSQRVQLEIKNYPKMTLEKWYELMKWMLQVPKHVKEDVKIIGIQPESVDDKERIRAFSKSKSGKELYWEVFNALLSGTSLRRTARKVGVSRGTVFRIKKEVQKAKHIFWVVGTFFVTMLSFQVARYTTDSFLLQCFIAMVATAVLIYMTYKDMEEDTD